MDQESAELAGGPQIAIFRWRNMRHTWGMTQHAHARALHLLADNGVDPETAAYIMKRLYDFGFTVRTRDTGGGASPPAVAVSASDARARIRAEVAAAREEKERERQAAIAAEKERRAAEDAARERQLAVAAVLASME